MSKRMIALLMCAAMLITCFAGCSVKKLDEDPDPGAFITMYLTDDIFDFDPANAYNNTDTLNVLSLMYDTLFVLDSNGKLMRSLVDEYEFGNDKRTGEPYLELTLKDTAWSNGTRISADDVAFAWRRLLTSSNNFAAASLLYDIKNARAVKEGDVSIDNVGIEALSVDRLKVTFEGPVDEEQFLMNLTSVATAPLVESYVTRNEDWAKKPSTMVTSGPFKLGKIFYKEILGADGKPLVSVDNNKLDEDGNIVSSEDNPIQEVNYFYLERNLYYYRDTERDDLTSSVTSYRILVDCTKTDEQIYNDYAEGKLFYIGSIPLSLRGNAYIEANKKVSSALSTFVLYMNQYANVQKDDGTTDTLFAKEEVRQALSLAIDRDAIAKAVVYAQAATGIVAPGVFNEGKIEKNSDFRTVGTALLTTSPNIPAAKTALTNAGIDPSQYSFTIKVAEYDEVNVKIVELVADAWRALDFNVTVEKLHAILNNDYLKEIDAVPNDVCDDRIAEAFSKKDYEVIAFDYTAFSATADSVLMNFATAFSGMELNLSSNQLNLHTTGYSSVEYNNLIEAVYYIPYFANLENSSSEYLLKAYTKKPFIDTAVSFANNATSSVAGVATSIRAKTQVGDLYKLENVNAIKPLSAALDSTLEPMQYANRELIRAYESANLTFDKQAEIDQAVAETMAAKAAAIDALDAAGYAAIASANKNSDKDLKAKAEAAIEKMNEAFATFIAKAEATEELFRNVALEATEAAQAQNSQTLYEVISEIYTKNGIIPTDDSSKWAAQKAVLLHKAEEQLMKDMPVIPVVFTQNATLCSDQLTNVNYKFTSMYSPYYFRKVDLKGFTNYVYYSEIDEKDVSIFADFPTIYWDKIGK